MELFNFFIPRSVLAIAILLCLIFIINRYLYPKFNRHRHYQRKANKIRSTLNSFPEKNREARQFSYLRKINPFVFEELLLNSLHDKGYKVIRNKRYTGDGGVDGQAINSNRELILIQAKRYSSYINPQHLKEFSQLVKDHKTATQGYFIHTGKTGSKSYQESGPGITIISGAKLLDLIKQV